MFIINFVLKYQYLKISDKIWATFLKKWHIKIIKLIYFNYTYNSFFKQYSGLGICSGFQLTLE
jgi:hypothetical protein